MIRLVFKSVAISRADRVIKKMKKEWLVDKNNHLENALIDVGAATKDKLDNVLVSLEKKKTFKGECKLMVLDILRKLQERSPLRYSIVRNCSSLVPKNMVLHREESTLRFRSLCDRLYALKKISSTADNGKNRFEEFINFIIFEHKQSFLVFDVNKDRLDRFFGVHLSGEDRYKDLRLICKLVFILSHGRSNIERGFSINKEVLGDNMKEKSIVSQRLVYDTLASSNVEVHEFQVSQELRKSCILACKNYKIDLAMEKDSRVMSSMELKRKRKFDEIENIKKQKMNLLKTIDSLKKGFERETLAADENQDLTCIAKAASLLRSKKEKENSLDVLNRAQKKLEEEYKNI